MPTYTINLDGKTIKLKGDREPTEAETREAVNNYFKSPEVEDYFNVPPEERLPVESKPLVEVKTPILKESSWLNMNAIHEIESNQGKNPNIYNSDGSYKVNKSGALGEYQIKKGTFLDPGAGLIKLGATKLPNYMKASTAEHREFAKNYILSLEKYFRQSYTYKEEQSPGLLDYEALAIAAYSRGIGTVQKLVKTHGSKRWRDHVKDDPGATETYLNKYNNFNKKNNTGFKQVQKEVNNEGIA